MYAPLLVVVICSCLVCCRLWLCLCCLYFFSCLLFCLFFFFDFVFFFFSSRRRHTRCLSDWSSDVCSSDLCSYATSWLPIDVGNRMSICDRCFLPSAISASRRLWRRPPIWRCRARSPWRTRSEERRVGKECRSGWSTVSEKKERDK